MSKEELFEKLKDYLLTLVPDGEWTVQNSKFDIQPPGNVGASGHTIMKDGTRRSYLFNSDDGLQLLVALHDATTEGGANKWNRMKFALYPDMHYDVEYSWDKVWQDEIDRYNREFERTRPGYKAPKWKWEQEGTAPTNQPATAATESVSPSTPPPIASFELAYLNPIHHGYPQWPGERWLDLYRSPAGTWIVLTNGMSNGADRPFEVYLETDDPMDPDSFSSAWQTNLVYEIGKLLPKVTDLPERLIAQETLSVQIAMDGAPEEWSIPNVEDNVGLFIQQDNTRIQGLLKEGSRGLNIKLLRPNEVLYCASKGKEGRQQLLQLLIAQGGPTISNLERKSVI